MGPSATGFCRARRGWIKIGPADQRLPFPLVLLFPVLGFLLQRRGQPAMALALLVQHDTYLRPGELCDLKVKQLVPPLAGAATLAPPRGSWDSWVFPSSRSQRAPPRADTAGRPLGTGR